MTGIKGIIYVPTQMLILVPCFVTCALQGNSPSAWIKQTFLDRVTVSAPEKLAKLDLGDPPENAGATLDLWIGKIGNCAFEVSAQVVKDPKRLKSALDLSEFVEGMVKPQSRIVAERDILVQGWQGLAITFELKNGYTMVARAVYCGDAVIAATCIYPSNEARPSSIDRFLDSLTFRKAGDQIQAGAPLFRYNLGDSEISALFPSKPTPYDAPLSHLPNAQIMHRFSSEYSLRVFVVIYRDRPGTGSISDKDRSSLYSAATNEVLDSLDAKAGNQHEFKVGADIGVRTEFKAAGHANGESVVFLHGRHLVTLIEFGPEVYEARLTIDSFLRSVEFKPLRTKE